MLQIQQEIVSEMADLGSWDKKYAYLIDLGKKHVVDASHLHQEEHRIVGCLSDAWLIAEEHNGAISFQIDHESTILRGVVVLLLRVYNHRTPEEIKATPAYFLEETGLLDRFSTSKANGLSRILQQIKTAGSNSAEV